MSKRVGKFALSRLDKLQQGFRTERKNDVMFVGRRVFSPQVLSQRFAETFLHSTMREYDASSNKKRKKENSVLSLRPSIQQSKKEKKKKKNEKKINMRRHPSWLKTKVHGEALKPHTITTAPADAVLAVRRLASPNRAYLLSRRARFPALVDVLARLSLVTNRR